MASEQGQCHALRRSDEQRCKNEATHANGLFCGFHAKEVFALYKGYKRRNAQLDSLDDDPPEYLKNSRVPLANDTFETINDKKTLEEVQTHLHNKYVLFNKVIDARKLHHKHFYSLNMDYGHQAYLDKLSSQRHTVYLALQRVFKRTGKVLFENEQWFVWVRKVQDVEEATQEKEQKKIKKEAALFRRHVKTLEARLKVMREKEEQKRQDAFLEDAYRERMSMSAYEDDDELWDPIDDAEYDKRYQYIDLIKHFLWMKILVDEDASPSNDAKLEAKTEELSLADEPQALSKKSKKKSKAKRGSNAACSRISVDAVGKSQTGQRKLLAIQESRQIGTGAELQEPDKNNIETEEEMRKRLSQGVKKNYENCWGEGPGMSIQIVGTLENPHETMEKTAPMTDDEIEEIVHDVKEIKLLLFCRLLLGQASLLPAAVRASSVEEFLNDAQVAESDLRDLCLKVEEPTLQQVRDACADFARGDEVEDDEEEIINDDDDDDETFEQLLHDKRRYNHLHTDDWLYEKLLDAAEKADKKKAKNPRKKAKSKSCKTKVTICGKSIWNHASEKAMSRDGWLQFSVIAKDCDLKNAIQLCRNWAEFSDLNLLTLWQYFPASNWVSWGCNRLIQQLQELEFFPYFIDLEAGQTSHHHQTGGRSQFRRAHDIVEARNIIVGHMKRNDPVTRRFLQYLLMRTGELLIMVRDGKTGRVITAPPEEHLWTYRKKQGLGRASKNEWQTYLKMGPEYCALTDILREWHFGFDDYYDVFIWDFVPGQSAIDTYNIVITELRNAWRIAHPRDVYTHMEKQLRGLTREKDTMRTRKIKPGEEVNSLWDTVMDDRNEFRLFDIQGRSMTCRTGSELAKSPYLFYNEANAAEDQVLFPDELISNKQNVPFREIRNGVNRIEYGIMPTTTRHIAKGFEAISQGKDPMEALEAIKDQDDDSLWAMPTVWTTAMNQVRLDKTSREQVELLKRTGLYTTHKSVSLDQRMEEADPMELMERDRSFGFKESFHAGDLEPGSTQKFQEVQEKIDAILKTTHFGSTDWAFFLAEILDWLELRGDYEDYVQDPAYPWPHSFIVQDLVRAFAAIAMFFPESHVTKQVTMFLNSTQCEEFRNSLLFDPKERSKSRPDRRTRTSYRFRDKKFWTEWTEFLKTERYYADVYPLDWSLAIRPIIAHLYRAGVIAPAYIQNDTRVIAGMATAKAEPHRPDKLDLFISYEDRHGNFPMEYPPSFVPPDRWTQLLPLIQKFAGRHPNARFALLRLWSAPHYYPLMVGLHNRQNTSFLDSSGRSWVWKFVPKDLPGSESSAHHTTGKRLQLLVGKVGDRVVSRGDLILVMGEDAEDLLKHCTVVTFAIQTKPWLREVDLWKSFINVGIEFFQDLDPFYLE